jgi:hypothetical protein
MQAMFSWALAYAISQTENFIPQCEMALVWSLLQRRKISHCGKLNATS